MKKSKYLFIVIVFISVSLIASLNLSAQLALNTSMTAQQLVQNVLVGTGVTVTNITSTGATASFAEFSNGGTTNIGLQRGILMCSGNVTTAIGPNNTSGAGTNMNTNGDPQLTALVTPNPTYDAAVLEFDFVPLSDTIRFRYVFGSEEYHEYVNSSYNDVFGFFISGPNPAGGNYLNKNIAIVPGTTNTPVSINNVNNGTSGNGPCTNCTYFINNNNGLTIQYDGITTVLTAWAVVTPCQSYHFKIAVADAGDHILDSGVFLEENSFSTDAIQVETEYSVPGAGKVAIEGCNDAVVKFTLPQGKQDTFWIHFDTIYGTATNGTDFPLLPDSLGVPPGITSWTMIVSPFVDGVIEGIEFLYVVIPTSQCTIDTLVIPIADYTPITTTTSPDTMVCYDTASLWVLPQQGAPPYTYQWVPNIGLTANNIANPSAMPPQDTTYYVYVSDTTGCPPVLDSIHVEVNPKPSVSFMPDILSGCEPLDVTFNDFTSPAIATWSWDFGDGNSSTSQSPTHTYAAGTYTISLSVMTTEGCGGQLVIPNLITAHQAPQASFDIDPPVTSIDHPVINFVDLSSYADSWYWDFGDGNTSVLQNPEHTYVNEGIYNVCLKVETVNGCKDSICQEAMVIVDRVEIPNIITPNGDGYNDVFYIENLDKIPDKKLLIFNRWGKKIYESNNYQNDWDGEGFSDGVYYYVLWIKTYFKEEEFNGSLTIMRQ